MGDGTLSARVLHALGVVLAVCLGVRVAAWLIEPVLPLLGALVMFGFIGFVLLGGSRHHL